MNPPLQRIGFAGTPAFAATALNAMLKAGLPVSLVLSQPDRPGGRGMKLLPSAVKQLALTHQLNIVQPVLLKKTEQSKVIAEANLDVLVVAAYGLILPQAVLDMPRLGCINIHASLLPRWRGAAPIHRAIEAGDEKTGITIMQMDAGLDTGKILSSAAVPIAATDTYGSLHEQLATLGGKLIVDALADLPQLLASAEAQNNTNANYAGKISKTEARLDWQLNGDVLLRKIHAFNPSPGAFSMLGEHAVKLLRAELVPSHALPADALAAPAGSILCGDNRGLLVACRDGALNILELQKPGSKRQQSSDFLNGFMLPHKACFN